jgi:uncharacterized Tic20 family protein
LGVGCWGLKKKHKQKNLRQKKYNGFFQILLTHFVVFILVVVVLVVIVLVVRFIVVRFIVARFIVARFIVARFIVARFIVALAVFCISLGRERRSSTIYK